jgi:hypothetical protein
MRCTAIAPGFQLFNDTREGRHQMRAIDSEPAQQI